MIPAQSIRHLLICSVGIVGFIALAIYPQQKSLTRLENKIEKMEEEIKHQDMLQPIAKDMLKEFMKREEHTLPYPKRKKLDREKASEASPILEEMARESGLEPISIFPEVSSLSEHPGSLQITAHVRGAFIDFREFLIKLGSLAYMEQVEDMLIRSTARGAQEMRLNIRLIVGK